ncbi:hypothetical protein [Streptomyces eurythermus]|uniref:hypothetical protein n=1 Tax=Streptomyces eurythermus TaxID=42237 RepID=UPI003411369F
MPSAAGEGGSALLNSSSSRLPPVPRARDRSAPAFLGGSFPDAPAPDNRAATLRGAAFTLRSAAGSSAAAISWPSASALTRPRNFSW